jgi:hypothetical protein
MNRCQAHLVVIDTHDAEGVFNEEVVFAAFLQGAVASAIARASQKIG